jgi:signal transduction histidine kinase
MTAQAEAANLHRRNTKCRHRSIDVRRGMDEAEAQDVLAQFSHELRNFLGIIRSAMHILKAGAVENVAHEEARLLIDRQVIQMTRMVDDLLDVSRLRKGGLQLNCARIDICVVVARAMRAVEYVMQQREHRMTVSYPAQALWLRGDEARLEQVFVNLLLNSAKYTDVGGDIGLSINREGDEAVIEVRDTGIGITANVLPRIFDLYVQGNPSSRDGGLGLGLPLVRALVESHGGRITAASEGIGRGSEFCVRLPAFTQP